MLGKVVSSNTMTVFALPSDPKRRRSFSHISFANLPPALLTMLRSNIPQQGSYTISLLRFIDAAGVYMHCIATCNRV